MACRGHAAAGIPLWRHGPPPIASSIAVQSADGELRKRAESDVPPTDSRPLLVGACRVGLNSAPTRSRFRLQVACTPSRYRVSLPEASVSVFMLTYGTHWRRPAESASSPHADGRLRCCRDAPRGGRATGRAKARLAKPADIPLYASAALGRARPFERVAMPSLDWRIGR